MNPQTVANMVSNSMPNPQDNALAESILPESKNKSGYFKKLLFGLLIFIIVVIFLIVSIIYGGPKILSLTAKDISPIDDKDFLPTIVKLPDKDNAFFDLNDMKADQPDVVIDYISSKKWDDSDVAQILDKNKAAFVKWDDAFKKASFQDPFYQDSTVPALFQPGYPHLYSDYQKMARLNTLRSLNHIKEGSDSAGLNILFETLDVGQKIQYSQSGLIGNLVGTSIKMIGFKGLQVAIGKLTVPHSLLILSGRRLDSYPFEIEALKEALKQEYFVQAYIIDSLVSGQLDKIYPPDASDAETLALRSKIKGGVKNNYLLQPNKTKSLFVNSFRSQISNVDKLCVDLNTTDSQKKPIPPTDIAILPFKENAIGELLFNYGTVTLDNVIHTKCAQTIELAATKLLFALRAYQLGKNSLPDSLDRLVPIYISSIPMDPYDGKQLKYSVSKKVIYSIGKDNKDDGGQGKINDLSARDYIIPINF